MLRRSSKPNSILLDIHAVPQSNDYLHTKPELLANLDSSDSQPSPFDKLRAGSAGLVSRGTY
jgi:hypothetical protein